MKSYDKNNLVKPIDLQLRILKKWLMASIILSFLFLGFLIQPYIIYLISKLNDENDKKLIFSLSFFGLIPIFTVRNINIYRIVSKNLDRIEKEKFQNDLQSKNK